ncbi:hypothetical protein KFK14_07825 [Sphingobium phenoxybenzoativorans]|uniref:Uncharacterized protein n=1 Tax=Sphingobium phenoxybenzoativorans TaxID=1592790 RepID=A0A975K9I4_9SPHN|nr:hypothetical protein [Sphingobium phenoxybenzoativorans]QUT07304.1 hypothetical protein KFK14_07825 [Sphingobium phenoxybenzoativorans]
MKADISLAERRRMERDQWAEIRAALAPRHFAAMLEEQAIAYYWVAHAFEAAPRIRAILAGMGCGSVPVPAPVVIDQPEPVAPAPAPVPLPVRASAPDVPFDMRERLGLR